MNFFPILNLFFPPRCVVCLASGKVLCGACRTQATPPLHFSLRGLHAIAIGPYEGALRTAILRMKRGRRDAAECLGMFLAEHTVGVFAEGAVFVSVPTTGERRRERGFDQSVLLANILAQRRGSRHLEVLERIGGAAQCGRTRAARLAPQGRFAVRDASVVQGLAVVLVDDVATTGGTLLEAASTLRRAGAQVLGAAVVARAP